MAEARTNLRLPEELYERIKQLADQERRSYNAQMVVLLEEGFAYRLLTARPYPQQDRSAAEQKPDRS